MEFFFFRFFSQFFTEAYQDKEIINSIFVQKYLTGKKYNGLTNNKSYNSKLGNIILKEILSTPKVNVKNCVSKSTKYVNKLSKKDKDIKSIMLKKYGKSKFSSKLGILRNSINKNSEKDFQKPKPSRTSIKKINFSIFDLDNSSMKVWTKNKGLMSSIEKKRNIEFNSKNFELNKIQNYMQNDYKIDKYKKQLNNFSSTDFNFPYYLYLLNIINKSFGVTRSCFVNQRFLELWEYIINVFDVTEFIKMQNNIDLINKKLFEIKCENEKNNIPWIENERKINENNDVFIEKSYQAFTLLI